MNIDLRHGDCTAWPDGFEAAAPNTRAEARTPNVKPIQQALF